MRSRIGHLGAATAVFLLFPAVGRSEWLCWTSDQGRRIECAAPDGSLRHDLITSDGKPMGMAVDHAGGTLFWAERDTERIMSMPLSGPAVATTIVQLPVDSGMRGMAFSSSIAKIYWVAENLQTIHRANLDGTEVEALPIPAGSFFDVEVDDVAGALYWTNGNEIWRGDLDGTSRIAIVGDTDQPYYLALDLQAGKLYWTDFARNEIGRSNLDGSNREDPGPVAELLDHPVGITLDGQTGKIYWTLEGGTVQRADFNGANVETVLSDLEGPWDICLLSSIPTAGSIPAASTWGLIALALSLLCAGTIVMLRRRHAFAENPGRTWIRPIPKQFEGDRIERAE